MTVQREFAKKLQARPSSEKYRATSALAQAAFSISEVIDVPASAFNPLPKVDSVVITLDPRHVHPFSKETISMVRRLFAFKGRLVTRAVTTLVPRIENPRALSSIFGFHIDEVRVEDLSPQKALMISEFLTKLAEDGVVGG